MPTDTDPLHQARELDEQIFVASIPCAACDDGVEGVRCSCGDFEPPEWPVVRDALVSLCTEVESLRAEKERYREALSMWRALNPAVRKLAADRISSAGREAMDNAEVLLTAGDAKTRDFADIELQVSAAEILASHLLRALADQDGEERS
jgi:hypothetical protein